MLIAHPQKSFLKMWVRTIWWGRSSGLYCGCACLFWFKLLHGKTRKSCIKKDARDPWGHPTIFSHMAVGFLSCYVYIHESLQDADRFMYREKVGFIKSSPVLQGTVFTWLKNNPKSRLKITAGSSGRCSVRASGHL